MITRLIELNTDAVAKSSARHVALNFAWTTIGGLLRPDDNPRDVHHLAEILHDRLDTSRFKVDPPALSDAQLSEIIRDFTSPIPDIAKDARVFACIGARPRIVFVEFESGTQLSIAHLFFAHITAQHYLVDPLFVRKYALCASEKKCIRDAIGHLAYNGLHRIDMHSCGDVIAYFECDE